MTKALAKAAKLELFEISTENDNDMAITDTERFRAFKLCQHILSRKHSVMILVDEVDNMFQPLMSDFFADIFGNTISSLTTGSKGFINRLLENNQVPSVWISNDINGMHDAFIRRFDIVFKMEKPPKHVREVILRRYFDESSVSENWISQVAENNHLVPAIVSRSAEVASIITDEGINDIEENALWLLNSTLRAMALPEISFKNKGLPPYDLNILNTDINIELMIQGIKRLGQGRICMYGPPGSGKTALARHISEKLDIELVKRRASEILNAYVGNTEKNLANIFMEAKQQGAILFLDEADSFLRERTHCRHQWEITQINELLTQMEDYNGILIKR
jgi:SpoVK/Ycf46/Vps4 family AAA+-type ATPase